MFIVPMGPGPDRLGVDYPNQQRKMEQLRMDIGTQSYNNCKYTNTFAISANSKFVIKIAGKPEPYWMM
jgi:hypothetical protein